MSDFEDQLRAALRQDPRRFAERVIAERERKLAGGRGCGLRAWRGLPVLSRRA